MGEINFDRKKAFQRLITGRIIGTAIYGIILLYGIEYLNNFLKFADLEFPVATELILGSWIILNLLYGFMDWLKIRTLIYTIEPSRLTEKYTQITRTINTARLQIVNSVDINQSLLDKLFDLFNVDVIYGFSEEGYNFSYNFLSEKTAEKIAEIIKPSGRIIKGEIV